MLRKLVGAALLLVLWTGLSMAGGRVALIVANQAYPDAPLLNPIADAEIIAPALEEIGFTVTKAYDTDIAAFDQALSKFQSDAEDADVALFYFSGHGFAVTEGLGAQNYLMSVSADITSASDRVLRSGGISLDDVILAVSQSAKVALVFVDACRNDPKVRSAAGSGRSLTQISDLGSRDVFVGLSTRLGSVATDGKPGEGTSFARSFAQFMKEPGLRIDDAFTKIRVAVEGDTDGAQRPDVLRYDLDVPLILSPATGSPVVQEQASVDADVQGTNLIPAAVKSLPLRISNGPEPISLDPHRATGDWENRIIGDYLEGLIAEDSRGEAIPGQAESWTVSADGLVYTFRLREGITWSDGVPVTADDFVFGFRRMIDPATAAENAYRMFPIRNAAQISNGSMGDVAALGVSAPDDRTVRIELESPVPYFIEALTHPITYPVPRHVVERLGSKWADVGNIVGNGPFRIVEWTPQQFVRSVKSDTYYAADRVAVSEVTYVVDDDPASALRRFRAGEVDISTDYPNQEAKAIDETLPGQKHVAPYLGVYYYVVNTTRAPFDDPKVRRAMSMAINRDIIGPDVLGSNELPAYGLIPDGTSNYTDLPYAPDWQTKSYASRVVEAKAIMAQLGYDSARPLALTLRYNTNDRHQRIAIAIAAMWELIGIKTTLLNADTPEHYEALGTGDFDVGRAGWILDYSDASNILDLLRSDSANNYGRYSNPAYDSLLLQAGAESNLRARGEFLAEAEALALDDAAMMPIYFYVSTNLVAPRVSGFIDNAKDVHRSRWMSLVE